MIIKKPKTSIRATEFLSIVNAKAAQVLALQYQLETTQWLPEEEIKNRQFKQLNHVFQHVLNTVPHYQESFKNLGIDSIPQNFDEKFMQQLPILQRADIQNNPDNFISRKPPKSHGKIYQYETSGSTGVPVRVKGSDITKYFWLGIGMRMHSWYKRDLSKTVCAIRWMPKGQGEFPQGKVNKGWGNPASTVFHTGHSCGLNISTPLHHQVEWLVSQQPNYFMSFPSNLDAITNYCKDNGIKLDNLDEILTIGETLTDKVRDRLEDYWRCPVHDIYSSEEVGYIGLQCPEHKHYHIQSEILYLELVNAKNEPCKTGEPGRVLLTTLNNFVTPLIRYEIGDIAEFGKPCGCGRNLPVINRILGRKRNRLIMPDGRSEFPYLGEHGQVENICGMKPKQFQFIQVSKEEILVKLVLEKPMTQEQEEKLAKVYQTNFKHLFKITYEYPVHIPKGPTGKFEEFMSEVEA